MTHHFSDSVSVFRLCCSALLYLKTLDNHQGDVGNTLCKNFISTGNLVDFLTPLMTFLYL